MKKINKWGKVEIIILAAVIGFCVLVYHGVSMVSEVHSLRESKKEIEDTHANMVLEYNMSQSELKLLTDDLNVVESDKMDLENTITELEIQIDQMTEEVERAKVELEYHQQIRIDVSDMRIRSNVTESELEKVLIGTGLEGLASAYIKAEKDCGINAIYLYALTALESSYGTSRIAVERNNISSFTAYDGKVDSHSTYFESKEQCIDVTAALLFRDYLAENGKYYNGFGLKDVNVKYASDNDWWWKINNIAEKAIDIIK